MLIEYWSDFTCPFCYIAETRLEKAIRSLGLEGETKLVFRAFELNPGASAVPKRNIVEGFARHYRISIDTARIQVDRINALGRMEGLAFRYGTAHSTNTFDALRIAKLAQSKSNDLCNAYAGRMYRAFFEENLIVSDHGVICRTAAEAGLDASEVSEALENGSFAQEVREDERSANAMGISAVPFFVINGRYSIPGAIDPEDMKRIITAAYRAEEDMPETAGMVCGPDGCRPYAGERR